MICKKSNAVKSSYYKMYQMSTVGLSLNTIPHYAWEGGGWIITPPTHNVGKKVTEKR